MSSLAADDNEEAFEPNFIPHAGHVSTTAMGFYNFSLAATFGDKNLPNITDITDGNFIMNCDILPGVDGSGDVYVGLMNIQADYEETVCIVRNCKLHFAEKLQRFLNEESLTIQRHTDIENIGPVNRLLAVESQPQILATDLVIIPQEVARQGFIEQLRYLHQDVEGLLLRNTEPSDDFKQILEVIKVSNETQVCVFAPVRFVAISSQALNGDDSESFDRNANLYTMNYYVHSIEPGCMRPLGSYDSPQEAARILEELNKTFLAKYFEEDPALEEANVNSFDYRRCLSMEKKPGIDTPNKNVETKKKKAFEKTVKAETSAAEKKSAANKDKDEPIFYTPYIVDCFTKQRGTFIEEMLRTSKDYDANTTKAAAFQFVQCNNLYELQFFIGETREGIDYEKGWTYFVDITHDQAYMLQQTIVSEIARVEFFTDGFTNIAETGQENIQQQLNDNEVTANPMDFQHILQDKPQESLSPFLLRTEQVFVPVEYMTSMPDDLEKRAGRSYQYCAADARKLFSVMNYGESEQAYVQEILGDTIYPMGFIAIQKVIGRDSDGQIYSMIELEDQLNDKKLKQEVKEGIREKMRTLLIQQAYDICMLEVDSSTVLCTLDSLVDVKAQLQKLEKEFILDPHFGRNPDLPDRHFEFSDHYSKVNDTACRYFDAYNTKHMTGMN